MAGFKTNGELEIKRLDEVVTDRVQSAISYFGTDAGTTENDVLGRAIRIDADSERDLWELAEAVFLSFNPAYATGVQLDQIVSYVGATRQAEQKSTVQMLLTGNYQTFVPANSIVSSSFNSTRWVIDKATIFNDYSVSGFTFQVISQEIDALYNINIGSDIFTYTSQSGDTYQVIAQQLANQINSNSSYNATISSSNDTIVNVSFDDIFVAKALDNNSRIAIKQVSKLSQATAEESGQVSAPPNTIDSIATPVTGWVNAINPVAATVGRERETDEQLRIRFNSVKELNATATPDAILSNIGSIVGVESVQYYENITMTTDSLGLPPKSYSVVVLGGDTQEIAEVIWRTKPGGIETYGNISVGVTDIEGLPQTVEFSRPEEILIYINVEISEAEGDLIPSDVQTQIANEIISYFQQNYSVGDDVIYSRMYLPILRVEGFQVDNLTIGTSSNPTGTSNIVIDFNQIPTVSASSITVTVND